MPKITYADTIRDATRGEFNDVATKEMTALLDDMQNAERTIGGKQKGKLTVTLEFILEQGKLFTQAIVNTKRPPRVKPTAVMFIGRDGTLSQEDTRQGALDFDERKDSSRDVSTAGSAVVRDISSGRDAAANDRK